MSTLKEIREKYLNSPKDFTTDVESRIGFRIQKVDIIDDTFIFNRLINSLENYVSDKIIVTPPFVIFTLVEDINGYSQNFEALRLTRGAFFYGYQHFFHKIFDFTEISF